MEPQKIWFVPSVRVEESFPATSGLGLSNPLAMHDPQTSNAYFEVVDRRLPDMIRKPRCSRRLRARRILALQFIGDAYGRTTKRGTGGCIFNIFSMIFGVCSLVLKHWRQYSNFDILFICS